MEPNEIQAAGVTLYEIGFYAAVIISAALGGMARTFRDNSYQHLWGLVGICMSSGCLAFGFTAYFVGGNGGASGRELYYVGLAALIGLMGKEQDQVLKWAYRKIAINLGIPLEEKNDAEN